MLVVMKKLNQPTAARACRTVGPAGTFTGIAIHYRPLGAVLAFSREMGRRLHGLIEPGHLDASARGGTTGRTT
jgi:hypothetical protein